MALLPSFWWHRWCHCAIVVVIEVVVVVVVVTCCLLEIDIVMFSLLFMLITYYSVMTDTDEHA